MNDCKPEEIKVEYGETLNAGVISKQVKRRWSILIIVIIIWVIVGTLFILKQQINESNKENSLYMKREFEKIVSYILEHNYKTLTFNSNETVITLEDLYKGIYGVKLEPNFFNTKGHQCLGFIFVTKNTDKYEIDSSHYCDMYE